MAKEEKTKLTSNGAVDLDSGVAPLTGKRVFYQLTDAEGGTDAGDGRKSLAFITRNRRGERDGQGRLVNDLHIFPCTGATPFGKQRVASDSARTHGTWDTVQPGDLRN